MKAYSSFEIQIDYYELMYKAKADLIDLLEKMGENNYVSQSSIPAWPQPEIASKTFHE